MKQVKFLTVSILAVVVITVFKIFYEIRYKINLRDKRRCPEMHHIISVIYGGNFANNVWEYMSLLSFVHLLERKLKIRVYVPEMLQARIGYVFENVNVLNGLKAPGYCFFQHDQYVVQINESYLDVDKVLNNSGTSIVLAKYSARYKEVIEYGIHNIKKEFRFRQKYVDYTNKIFNDIKRKFNVTDRKVTFIGVHYRGTDYIPLLQKNYNYSFKGPTGSQFYTKAMNYFKRKYKLVIFILITIDYKWLEENLIYLRENNNLLLVNPNRGDYAKDFALLSHCNHSIINYGTFGATSALFAQGTKFVFDLGIPLDQRGPTVGMGIATILPNWHLLT